MTTSIASAPDTIKLDPIEPDYDGPAAAEFAAGLRAMATAIEEHPRLAEIGHLQYGLGWVLMSVGSREAVQLWARAGLAAGARVTKHQGDTYGGVDVHFGPVVIHVYVRREEICERVVVGTREVTKEIQDPEALAAVPKVTVTETVEDVAWRCLPLLGDEAPGGAR